uniref:Uncharacterized protein n=1 Tax=Myoviridae sp. ctBoB21 TaxID=2827287 RepID=A0A8S5R5S0_9CAUD|nr:MAG TPA: hypothetical protein [Myoviridae sp. ctBoB21]
MPVLPVSIRGPLHRKSQSLVFCFTYPRIDTARRR